MCMKMLESQSNEGNGRITISKRLKRAVYPWRNEDVRAMDYSQEADQREPGSSWSLQGTGERISSGTRRYVLGLGQEVSRSWRDRPRDATTLSILFCRNLLALLLILISGVVTWESSVPGLRDRYDRTIPFPLYLPHSVALAVACVWTASVIPANFVGLYLTRLYLIWRGGLGFTAANCLVLLAVCVLTTCQSHLGGFILRKLLCKGTKKVPTIDSVKEAMWYLTTVFFLSLFFSIIVALVTAITPMMQWASFWRYWTTWWLGILATMITVTPLLTHLLSWEYKSYFKNPCKSLECLLVALTTAAVVTVVFFINFVAFRPRAYMCFPVITWTAFRFNRVGWALTISAVAYCSAVGSIRKRGALYSNQTSVSSPELILQIQLFVCVIGVVGITLAAAVREKKHLTKRLRHWNVELEQRIDTRTAELRKANEELQISQRNAEQASQSKSDFLANMSHEIRTPIHGILGLTALLLESELTCDQKESLVSVKECADLLLHIINSVLDLAKIEAGRLEVENVPFNIRKMASSTFRMLQPRAQQRGLGLLLEIDNGVPQSLVGDVGKLQQCLLNLVGNALKFTHKGSVSVHVKVAAEQIVKPSIDTDDDLGNKVVGRSSFSLGNSKRLDLLASMFLEFEVRDTGIGISQETLRDMFKPFTQADASTSRLYGGTGLGLCIVQRFVDLLGGTLWAESVIGKGSAFHFRLPFYLNKPKESPPESPRLKPDNSFRQWSLMGGLTFNPNKQVSEVNEQDAETRTPKVRSASDFKQLAEEGNGHVEDFEAVTPAQVSEGRKRRDRLRGSSNLEKALSDPTKASNFNNGDSVRSDRSASSEVTSSGQEEGVQVQVQPLLSQTSSTLSDWGERSAVGKPCEQGPFDSSEALERERGRAAANAPSPARSDLSRESSADLDSMIKNKVSLEILLAEDNAINQKIASRQLEKHGHKVTIVGDGKQALDVVSSRHDSFDLVLMDVQMPVMDGLMATELIRKAESENGWTRLPVLGLTAHAIHGYQDTCLRHGMDGYLGKPFEIHQLLKTIGHLLPPDKLGHRA